MKPSQLLPLIALLVATPAAAQLSLEGRAGASIGNDRASHAGLEAHPGLSASVGAALRVHPVASLYAAWSRAAFGCEESLCAGDRVTFTSSGLSAGVRLQPGGLPWVRLGALLHSLNSRTATHEQTSGSGAGYEVATGFALPVHGRLRLLPGLTYRTHAVPDGEVRDRATLLSAEVGLQLGF